MSLPITNVLANSSINIILSGSSTYNINGTTVTYSLSFTPYQSDQTRNEVSLQGSSCSASYLGNPISDTTSLMMTGSGGGTMAGLSEIIYINMTGMWNVIINHEDPVELGKMPGQLYFTGLLEIAISGASGTMNLVNPQGEIYLIVTANGTATVHKLTFLSISLEDPSVSVSYANCTRYICLGDFKIRFQN